MTMKKAAQLPLKLHGPVEAKYRTPDMGAPELAGLCRVLATAHMNGWAALARVTEQQIAKLCRVTK